MGYDDYEDYEEFDEGPSEADLERFGDDEDESLTLPCPHCKREVYEEAEQCPYCGEWMVRSQRLHTKRNVWFVVIVLLMVAAVLWWVL